MAPAGASGSAISAFRMGSSVSTTPTRDVRRRACLHPTAPATGSRARSMPFPVWCFRCNFRCLQKEGRGRRRPGGSVVGFGKEGVHTMRFMIMHKNDPKTEAGNPPPMELVHKMGEFVGGHAQAGRLVDGAGLGGSKTRTRLVFRDGQCTTEARPLSRRARAAGGDAAAEGRHARGGHRLGGALRQDPRRRRARARQGQRAVGHRPDAGAGESAAADAAHREGRPGDRGAAAAARSRRPRSRASRPR